MFPKMPLARPVYTQHQQNCTETLDYLTLPETDNTP